ncbi:uncharacterized protein BXZ73DRAFT_77472 [Epithele typhae]|uniref:uncharacterized protein n=1 Tax=Epithele typhae TaxID=378194 RepID=UPI0020083438|nr:uncharacterized protein BXZ73DRAFT_77472 [Epithele typhae]KAH9932772.1 hypothetical protein BXZ73DRAFT_77472 [Epithele typhae]
MCASGRRAHVGTGVRRDEGQESVEGIRGAGHGGRAMRFGPSHRHHVRMRTNRSGGRLAHVRARIRASGGAWLCGRTLLKRQTLSSRAVEIRRMAGTGKEGTPRRPSALQESSTFVSGWRHRRRKSADSDVGASSSEQTEGRESKALIATIEEHLNKTEQSITTSNCPRWVRERGARVRCTSRIKRRRHEGRKGWVHGSPEERASSPCSHAGRVNRGRNTRRRGRQQRRIGVPAVRGAVARAAAQRADAQRRGRALSRSAGVGGRRQWGGDGARDANGAGRTWSRDRAQGRLGGRLARAREGVWRAAKSQVHAAEGAGRIHTPQLTRTTKTTKAMKSTKSAKGYHGRQADGHAGGQRAGSSVGNGGRGVAENGGHDEDDGGQLPGLCWGALRRSAPVEDVQRASSKLSQPVNQRSDLCACSSRVPAQTHAAERVTLRDDAIAGATAGLLREGLADDARIMPESNLTRPRIAHISSEPDTGAHERLNRRYNPPACSEYYSLEPHGDPDVTQHLPTDHRTGRRHGLPAATFSENEIWVLTSAILVLTLEHPGATANAASAWVARAPRPAAAAVKREMWKATTRPWRRWYELHEEHTPEIIPELGLALGCL